MEHKSIHQNVGMAQPTVLFYQRRPRPLGNFSLEAIFEDVRIRLANDIKSTTRISHFYSNGFLRRCLIALDAWWHQKRLTHITGDIHFAALLLKRQNCILTVLDCGDLVGGRGWKQKLRKLVWFDLPVWKAAKITTISEAAKRDIVALTGCSESKISVIPVAISERFQRIEQSFNAACPRVLQVGCAINKNIERLAVALQGINCQLSIVGQPTASQLNALNQANIDFEYFPRLSDEEILEQYAASDIVAFASTYEGFGMPIIEAQTIGRVVVTSNCSSMPEVAGTGALLVDPLDVRSIREGIQRIISDSVLRESLIQNGFENAKRFDAETIAQQYLNTYIEFSGASHNHVSAAGPSDTANLRRAA
jgi:glycosyltransferase involved in cell wall biosynthesis